jgi:1,4-alpha-glucan branching enzyme
MDIKANEVMMTDDTPDVRPMMDQAFLFNTGRDHRCYNLLGAHPATGSNGGQGWRFAVWAPKAAAVAVAGTFNEWDETGLPLVQQGSTGIWTGFTSNAAQWDRYKYAITTSDGTVFLKADPLARHSETRPGTASILYNEADFDWSDMDYLQNRLQAGSRFPLNIYEVHLGSWRRHEDGSFMNYRQIALLLGAYLIDMGYTAVELLPVMEHPLDDSWGYQVTGYFSVTSRFGTPADFKFFINHLHGLGIRVILDWVPAHFPRDAHGLARFDGSALFEYADSRLGEHQEWGTYVFNYARDEVRSFLISNALFWISEFHVDGLRVDAVSSMLYRNYGRTDYLPNIHGGSENLEAITFLREMNATILGYHPDVMMIAEESTAFCKVSHPINDGGLGFTHKWNMGWMHDTLEYMGCDFANRKNHQDLLSFSMTYAFSENFILPFSHDEVVHGKRSLIERMPGDNWRRFASLRVLLLYQLTHPGAKLMFMGGEFGQFIEWRFYEQLEWFLLDYEPHRLLQDFVRQINHLYRNEPSLYEQDDSWNGFSWHNLSDTENSVLVYSRWSKAGEGTVVVLNLSPNPLTGYCIGVPWGEPCRIVINSDDLMFGGSGYPISAENEGTLVAISEPRDGQPASLVLDIPPLAGLFIQRADIFEKPNI